MVNKNKLTDLQVSRESLSDQVAEQLQQMIIQGGLLPGEKLPPERDLCEQLGVSRTVIREAVKRLQVKGLVRVVGGSGTYISRVDPGVVSQSIGLLISSHNHSFQDLLEIRRFFEVEIAGLAAERATSKDIENLHTCLNEMQDALVDIDTSPEVLEQFVQADIRFHHYLAAATHNSLFPVLHTSLADLLKEFSGRASSVPGAPKKAVEYHNAILASVKEGTVRAARKHMLDHILNGEKLVSQLMD